MSVSVAHPEREITRPEPTTAEKLRALPWSMYGNVLNTFFAQFTFFGSTFVMMLSLLGMDKTQIGFLLSLMPFAGLVALFIGPAVAAFGYKRTYVTFWAVRKAVTALLLLTPWVLATYGHEAMVLFVTVVTGGFALARAIGETGYFPWYQEFIPNSVRGRYSAMNSVYITVAGLVAVGVSGFVLDRWDGLTTYMWLIAVGIVFGFVAVWAYTRVPGGAPSAAAARVKTLMVQMAEAGRDRNFVRYLTGAALITIATVPMVSFIPLYMQEEVGLSAGNTVLLQAGTLLGVLVTSLPWGWASDRYGSKPVMLLGLGLKILLPVAWFMIPHSYPANLYAALTIAAVLGISDVGWAIGAGRLLFVSVVPPAQSMAYMSLHYAWVGVIGGTSQLLGGWILQRTANLAGEWYGVPINPYTPLFVLGFVLTIAALLLLRNMRADNIFGVGEFAGMFFRGNPFLAMTSLIRYYGVRGERHAVSITEQMGRAKSPLAVDELLEALQDPRFNVRFEAMVAIARMPADARLTKALIEVLNGTELALESMAAWALGRTRDPAALDALRNALNSEHLSIRAHAARALGAQRDVASAGLLMERLRVEQDKGLQMAYVSALGNLGAVEALDLLLELLPKIENKGARREMALSIARMVGDEGWFVHLVRQSRTDPGTTLALGLGGVQKKLVRGSQAGLCIDGASDTLARQDLERGAQLLAEGARLIVADKAATPAVRVLAECARRLDEFGATRMEYLLLAVYAMHLVVES